MKKVEVDSCMPYSEKSYKAIHNETVFWIPKSVVVGIFDGFVVVEDWFKFDNDVIKVEDISLLELMEGRSPKDIYLTGVEYKYNPKCFDIQNEAIDFCISRKFALINLWTGAGKTFIYLGIIDGLCTTNNVIVCPVNLKKQLESEIKKHFPNLEEKIRLITYSELSLKDVNDLDIDDIDVLIFDEVHRVKNSISMSPPKLTTNAMDLAHKAIYVYGGSATPSPNGSHDLLGVMRVLHPELRLYTDNTLRRSYCKMYKNRVIGLKRLIDFCNDVSPYIFYRKREDFEDIPYTEIDYPLLLTEYETLQYKQKFDDFRDKEPYCGILKQLSMMKRFLYDSTEGGKGKKETLKNIIDGIEGQVIIFVDTVNTENNEVESVMQVVGLDNCAFMIGGKKTLDSFVDGKKRFLITSYGSGSEGLNLQFCSNIIFYGHNFNYMTRSQSYGRIRRYGQKEVCKYHNIYYANSVEGSYMNSLKRKKNIVADYEDAFNNIHNDKILLGNIDE